MGHASHLLRADEAAGTSPIIDNDALAERAAERFSEEAREDVGRAGGCEGHDQTEAVARQSLGKAGFRPIDRPSPAAARRM
jgi:hypothetical protein